METEQSINQRIREFQKKFGIIDEGAIVDEYDFEKTIVFEDAYSEAALLENRV